MNDLGKDIKKLGFGLMRLPQKDGVIDVEETSKMLVRKMRFARRWLKDIHGKAFS